MKKLLTAGLLLSASLAAWTPNDEGKIVHSLNTEIGGGYLGTHTRGYPKERIDDKDFGVISGTARMNVRLSDSFSTQFDLEGLLGINERKRKDDEEYLQHYWFTSGHFAWRKHRTVVAGLLGGTGQACGGQDEEAQIWYVGAELMGLFGDFTLLGQAGHMDADDETRNDCLREAWWARVQGRCSLSDHTKVEAEFAWSEGQQPPNLYDVDGDDVRATDHVNCQSWGARLDQAIEGGPCSLWIGYFGSRIHRKGNLESGRLIDHCVQVGVEVALGAQNYRDEFARGATLSTPCHSFGHWCGWTVGTITSAPTP